MKTEIWKSIKGSPKHRISDLGRIKSLIGYTKIIGTYVALSGYHVVRFTRGGKIFLVHLLVLEAFVGPRPKDCIAHHKNGIKTDNRVTNLE